MQHETRSNPGRALWAGKVAGLGAAALLALAACGGADDPSGADGGTEAADDVATAGTTPENPLPIGATVEILDWDVTVTGVELDATQTIDDASFFSPNLPSGRQLAMVTYEGTYKGDDPENSFRSELVVGFVIDGVVHDDCGGGLAPGVYVQGAVAKGDTVTSAFCAEIPTDQAEAALVRISEWTPVTGRTEFYFATS